MSLACRTWCSSIGSTRRAGSVGALLEALQPLSVSPLIARQVPITSGDKVTGFVDVALERAFHYRPRQAFRTDPMPAELDAVDAQARTHLSNSSPTMTTRCSNNC
jgi:hypothetical protein